MQLLRRIFDFLFWWIVLLGCVSFIGYIAWPLLSDTFYDLCSNNSEWKLCRGDWNKTSRAGVVQETIESKTGAFANISKTAASDVLTDDGGKTTVTYKKDEKTGVYMPVK